MLPDPADLADREMSKILEGFKTVSKGCITRLFVTEKGHTGCQDNDDPSFDRPKAKDICGLLEMDTLEIMCKEDVEKGTNVVRGIFVLASKNVEIEKPVYKELLVVHGHTDQEKDFLVHSASISPKTFIQNVGNHGSSIWIPIVVPRCLAGMPEGR